jgi:hypothetical protein
MHERGALSASLAQEWCATAFKKSATLCPDAASQPASLWHDLCFPLCQPLAFTLTQNPPDLHPTDLQWQTKIPLTRMENC